MMRCSWDVSSECVAQENSDSVVPQSKELLNEEAVSLEVSEVSKYVMGCNGNSELVYVVLLESSRDSPTAVRSPLRNWRCNAVNLTFEEHRYCRA